MQPWLLNEALCSRLPHSCYHRLPRFSASRDAETKSQGRPKPTAGHCSVWLWGPSLPMSQHWSINSHCPAPTWEVSTWPDRDLRNGQPFNFKFSLCHDCPVHQYSWFHSRTLMARRGTSGGYSLKLFYIVSTKAFLCSDVNLGFILVFPS